MESPGNIYKRSFAIFFALIVITLFVLFRGDSAMQQNGFGVLLIEFALYIVVLFFLSVVTSIVYKEWFRKNWGINTVIFIVTGVILALILSALSHGGIG